MFQQSNKNDEDIIVKLRELLKNQKSKSDCVNACAADAAACVEACPPNDTIEGKRCVIACGYVYRKCVKKCEEPPDIKELDRLLSKLDEIIDS